MKWSLNFLSAECVLSRRGKNVFCHKMTLMILLVISTFNFNSLIAQTEWTKHPSNPVLNVGPPGSWDAVYTSFVTVVSNNSLYHMWYTGYDGTKSGIGYATSPDGITWTKHPNNPVLQPGSPGSWDADFMVDPSVLFDGVTYHMWYEGFDGIVARFGYATSTNGSSWTKHPSNPVLGPGISSDWDDTIRFPDVLFDGSKFHMWYSGVNSDIFRIGYATSSNGVNWTKHAANPVLNFGATGAWDESWVYIPSVIWSKTDSIYRMWYTGVNGQPQYRIGYATSRDGIAWVKHSANPVLQPNPSFAWEKDGIFAPSVLFNGKIYQMWYSGAQGNIERTGYATSPALTSVADESSGNIPNQFALFQNYPNPFKSNTEIHFQLPVASHTVIKVFNVFGEEIRVLTDARYNPGSHRVRWDGKNDNGAPVSSGIYLYQLKTANFAEVKKLIMLQ